MKNETLEIAKKAREALIAKKGEDIIILDVRKLSSVTDFYLVATGRNGPHIKALINEAEAVLSREGLKHYRKAGTSDSEWMVIDFMDLVVHVFSPTTRKYYELERLWSDARIVS
ncbi:MAG TPA: ribosome silencing factor [Verrucomicrobia bacterium]|nr:MAG: ribosome silencing factor [Lentisphaerae bacterium GWF2_57_35]HBA84569.1 ribosome silencing factor [Verrucomicrobiota bacterium]